MRTGGRFGRICGLLAIALGMAGAAGARCASEPPAARGTSPLAPRFAELAARDRYRDVAAGVADWQALVAALRAGDSTAPLLPLALARLAWGLEYLGRIEEARPVAAEAKARVEQFPAILPADLTDVLATFSMVEVDAGGIDAADAAAARARATILRAAPESAAASFAENAVANVAYARGDYAGAERAYAAATDLAVRCLAPERSDIVNNMASHAGTLYMLGRNEEALAENERAARWALAHLEEASPVVTLALGNLGVMLRGAGRYAEAEAALRRVVDLEARYQHDSWFYRAISLSNFATAIDAQGRHREAEALWLRASEWHARAPVKRDPATRAYPLRYSADAAQARGDLALALRRRRRAIALMAADAPADHPELARARIELGRTLALLGRAKEGLALADPALAIVRARLGADDIKRLSAEIDHARIIAAARGRRAGYAAIAPLAARLERRLLDSATSRGDLIRYGPIFSASFAFVADLALATGREETAFRALQLANLSEVVLVASDVAARVAAGSGAGAAPLRALQDHVRERQALDRARSFAAAAGDGAKLTDLDAALRAEDTAIADAARALDALFPDYRALSRPEPVSLATFRAGLAPGEALLAPLPLDDGTLAITITREGLRWRRSRPSRAAVSTLVARIRASITREREDHAGRFDEAAARALYRALLPPGLAAAISRHPSLLYFATGPLATLPPALLIAPGRGTRWLIRDHDVTILPTLAAPRAGATDRSASRFLGIGAPLAQPGGPAPLPFAERELREIATALAEPATLLLGPHATPAAVGASAGSYDVVAFATHALTASDGEPAFALTGALLTASDVARLPLDANWVILSACDTAGDADDGARGHGGLAAAFLHAGARALLVSHWPVRDDAAAALTVATVRNARGGMSRARALRAAMLSVMADRRLPGAAHPAVWAPFVLVGR